MTSSEALKHITNSILPTYDAGEAASIAAIVLEDGFNVNPQKIIQEIVFDEIQVNQLNEIVKRLLAHEPVQYILGKTIFYGLPFKVNPNVLIPRQETEELVAWIIETLNDGQKAGKRNYRILDIGTGSGCIPIALKKNNEEAEIHALDVSKGALKIAMENAELNNVDIEFHEVDILNENNWSDFSNFDLIVSNPPYITENEKGVMPENVLKFEPHLALFSGNEDALIFYKKITKFALEKLNKDGWLFYETNEFNAEDARQILIENRFNKIEIKKDINKKNRMLRGKLISNFPALPAGR